VEEHGRRGRHRDRFGNHELLRGHHGEWFSRGSQSGLAIGWEGEPPRGVGAKKKHDREAR
jgi:hypothetical protein